MSGTADVSHAIIPLALLEALQDLDAPVVDDLPDVATELIAKRLGLSGTVAAQAARYERRLRTSATVDAAEAIALFTLLGRRPDHELLFADAGRRAARRAIRLLPARRVFRRVWPRALLRRAGLGTARRLLRRVLDGTLVVERALPAVVIDRPLSVRSDASDRGCVFYGTAFGEILRLVAGYEGAVQHTMCRARGDSVCRWRTAPPAEFTR